MAQISGPGKNELAKAYGDLMLSKTNQYAANTTFTRNIILT